VWESNDLSYWIESCRLQLKAVKLPSCELQAVNVEFDTFTVSTEYPL